jgi:hypothetical protein
MEPVILTELIEQHDAANAWLREIVLPEEDRRTFTAARSSGYRWFKSENVIDLEAVRTLWRNCGKIGHGQTRA